MQLDFIDNFCNIQKVTDSTIGIIFQSMVARMPVPIRVYDNPFFPFAKAVISVTRDVVCGAYVSDLAAYLSIGAAGAIALERSIAYIGKDNLTILSEPFSGTENYREIWLADPELLHQSSRPDFADAIRQQLIEFQLTVKNNHE